jgi:hypothetical protein
MHPVQYEEPGFLFYGNNNSIINVMYYLYRSGKGKIHNPKLTEDEKRNSSSKRGFDNQLQGVG